MADAPYSFHEEFAAFLPTKPASTLRPRGADEPAAAGSMGSAVSVATHPPLGQVTQVASGAVTFYAVVETRGTEEHDKALEVALWHSPTERAAGVDGEDGDGPAWTATALQLVEKEAAQKFWALQEEPANAAVVRRYYRAVVQTDGPLHFTVKFRESNGSASAVPWRWVGDEQQIGDGTVVVNARTAAASIPGLAAPAATETIQETTTPQDLQDLIGGLGPAFRVSAPRSQSPDARLWQLDLPVRAVEADGDDRSAYTTAAVGAPWHGRFLRWFALVRIWTPWLAPRHGRGALDGSLEEAVLASFLDDAGRHLVFLAVSGVDHVQGVFQGDSEGNLVLAVRSDSLRAETATVLVAAGDSFECANAAVMYHARSLVHQMAAEAAEAETKTEAETGTETDTKTETETKTETPDNIHREIAALAGEVRPAWLENWYDGLGFCTWNALGQNLSEDKIVAAVDALAAHGIQVANLIIDDNWQAIDRSSPDGQFQYTWTRFEADPAQFPQGLKHAVRRLRDRHPAIQHVAVWHALLGYWGGLTPGGDLATRYATRVVDRAHPKRRNLKMGGPMTVVDEPDVRRFYDDFYRFLVDAGVDGVKTDAQFMMDAWTSAAARRSLTTAYQDAWTVAALRHFGGRAVSCMSQTPAILFYSQLPQDRPPLLVRNSDDFFPDVPASHPWHVWTNAHNSLLTQHLNVLPDWDMFQTVHGYSGFHAAARCVSGGPIYITDVPGQHDLGLIGQMTGRSVYGKTVVFRPSVVGRSLDQYVGFHDGVLLKVGSYHGGSAGAGLLGVFNVSDRRLAEIVPLARVPGVVAGDDEDDALFVARAHSSGHVTAAPVRADALLTLALDVYGYEIVSAYRVQSFAAGDSSTTLHVANLGLVGKMAAAATIVSTSYRQRGGDDKSGGRVELQTSLKAPGVLGLYVSGLAEGRRTIEDSFLVTMRGQPIPLHCVAVSAQDRHVLEIDTARAWRELGFAPMMNNEVQLTVYISVEEAKGS